MHTVSPTIIRTILIAAGLAGVLTSLSCDHRDRAADKAALEEKVAALERQNAEIKRQAGEELEKELAAVRAELDRERAAMRSALESGVPKAVIVEEEADAAKLAVEIQDIPAEELQRISHDQLVEIAGRISVEVADRLVHQDAGPPVGREPLPALPQAEEDYGVFFANLQNFGTWFQTTDYGYVWQPAVVQSDLHWRPYTLGHWVWSDEGWVWASDEPFGWATYHYGRWAMLESIGWVWIPGEQWAPAWVSWRSNDDYVGWAPLPPETLYNEEIVYDSRVDDFYGVSFSWYIFVPSRTFGDEVWPVCLPPRDSLRIARATTNVTHLTVRRDRVRASGIDYAWVNSRRGSAAPKCELTRIGHQAWGNRPPANHLRGGRMEICAPKVTAGWNAAVRPGSVSKNLGRVTVARSGRTIERAAMEHYYGEALRRQEIARRVAASEQGRQALMRRQIALTRAQEQTRVEGQRYREQSASEARVRARERDERFPEQERVQAENTRRQGEPRLRQTEDARTPSERTHIAEQRGRAETERRQAEDAARQADVAAKRAEDERARREAQQEPARRAEMERRQAEDAKRQADVAAKRAEDERARREAQQEQARRAETERRQAEDAKRQADVAAKRAEDERAKQEAQQEAQQEQARRAEAERRQGEAERARRESKPAEQAQPPTRARSNPPSRSTDSRRQRGGA